LAGERNISKTIHLVCDDILKKAKMGKQRLNIHGERLHNLRFANDITVFVNDKQELINIELQK